MSKKLIYADGEPPYTNEYSNSNDPNIIWDILQENGPATNNEGQVIYYSPAFVQRKALEFVGKSNKLEHVRGSVAIGECVDVVYNNNGIILSSGDKVPPDNRVWACCKLYPDALALYGLKPQDIYGNYGFSTTFDKVKFGKNLGPVVNGIVCENDVPEVVDAEPAYIAITKNPKLTLSSTVSNSLNGEQKPALDINCNTHNQFNDDIMADGEELKKIIGEAVNAAVGEAVKVAVQQQTDEIKKAVSEAVQQPNDAQGTTTNNSCDGDDDKGGVNNSDDTMAELEKRLAAIEERLAKIEGQKNPDNSVDNSEGEDGEDDKKKSNIGELASSVDNSLDMMALAKANADKDVCFID